MIAARGEDTNANSLEKFAQAGRPKRIEVEVIQRVKALGVEHLSPEIRQQVLEKIAASLDAMAGELQTALNHTDTVLTGYRMFTALLLAHATWCS